MEMSFLPISELIVTLSFDESVLLNNAVLLARDLLVPSTYVTKVSPDPLIASRLLARIRQSRERAPSGRAYGVKKTSLYIRFTKAEWLICIKSVDAVLAIIPLWEFNTLIGASRESAEEFLLQAHAGEQQ